MRSATKLLVLVTLFAISSSSVMAAESAADDGNIKISHDRYVWGGIAGTVLGFGLGHAIQERYLSGGGWAFTLCEGIGAAAVITGGVLYALANANDSQRRTGERFMLAGSIFWGGFKIWETVDLWVAPHVTIISATDKTAESLPVIGASASW
jgi:hypothetical protein